MPVKKFLTAICGLLAVIGGLWILNKILIKPVQHVLLCDENRENCQVARAEFAYDGMDGQFSIKKLYREDATITFSPVDCWVKVDGSTCMNSSNNQNMTGVKDIIIPLAYKLNAWRWNRD